MLKKRIIPIVLLDGFSVLKTINFEQRRNLGSPVTVMRTYNTRNVDELVLLDIDASKQNRAIDKFTIEEIAKDCFMPLTVGGGIKTIKDIEELLKRGADKVSINTYAFENIEFIREASKIFGAQCIVGSVDVVTIDNEYFLYSNGNIYRDIDVFFWVKKLEEFGAGEILLNNVSLDGMMTGADANLASLIASELKIPVIYAGGISSPEDAAKIALTEVSGVGISSIFHFTDSTPADCKQSLREHGVPARL